MMRRFAPLLIACGIGLTDCGPGTGTARAAATPGVAAATPGARAPDHVTYTGHWEFVQRHYARTARSYHADDSATLVYHGESLRIFGITGPQGGRGIVVVPGLPPVAINFHSAQRKAHVLLYTSPRLPPGLHSLSIVVTTSPDGSRHHGYVNLEGYEVSGANG